MSNVDDCPASYGVTGLLGRISAHESGRLEIPKSTLRNEGARTVRLWTLVGLVQLIGLSLLAAWQDRIDPRSLEFRVISVASILSTWLAAAPFIRFLDRGWYVRYDEFQNGLTDTAIRVYLVNFWSNRIAKYGITGSSTRDTTLRDIETLTSTETQALFERVYIDQYGIGPFIVPLFLTVSIVFGQSILAMYLVFDSKTIWGASTALVVSAIAGAYLFSIGDAVLSVRKRSLNVSDAYWYSLRLALAVPVGIAFGSGSGGVGHTAIAFAISALPVDALVKTIRSLALRGLGSRASIELPDQLISLQGVTAATSSLLAAEGITSIEQLASMDPILISIRTGLPFKLVLFFGSQAVVRRRLGEGATNIISLGLADVESICLLLARYEEQCGLVMRSQSPLQTFTSDSRTSAPTSSTAGSDPPMGADPSATRQPYRDANNAPVAESTAEVSSNTYPAVDVSSSDRLLYGRSVLTKYPFDVLNAKSIVLAAAKALHPTEKSSLDVLESVTLFQFSLIRDDACTGFLIAESN
ncbi:hypothetical protein [Paraburkholderia sp. BL25I1N1]|uniref:hypothetical protein n=1 Tax=Paraburkholderia sp. BL25I1N1 TaxID=1938804 RepID=UPI000D053984|nr:hypothetical protein [Paraburkholderia sp. BL25I1N1]PRY06007.1 hypothetical protein B0G73_108259 [Paraburkholderia sp. BL25I1N1]